MLLGKVSSTKTSQQLLLDINYCLTLNKSPKDLSIDSNHSEQAHSMTSGSSSDQSPSSVLSISTSSASAPTMLMFGSYHHRDRKRRRMIGNLDNTLDGLVAKRTEFDPLQKRYQTENEAIELPDDEMEMKRMETDPDVSTRMCSVCGYQGKWVSEMIRHKRVHTNDRPFKCKYCNRTSKWKADLIRHVAKTHGIRVVSKYSRSKTFDSGTFESSILLNDKKPHSVIQLANHEALKKTKKEINLKSKTSTNSNLTTFRCLICFFEQESMDVIAEHLHNVHNVSPFECLKCNTIFEKLHSASEHCAESPTNTCTSLDIRVNFGPVYNNNNKNNNNSISKTNNFSSASSSSINDKNRDNEESLKIVDKGSDNEMIANKIENCCQNCPFKCLSSEKFKIHQTGHNTFKNMLNYNCLFCNWSAKKKSLIERHMLIHTPHPERLMAQVEQNFAKNHFSKTQPLSLQLSSPQPNMSTFKNTSPKSNKLPLQASAFIAPHSRFPFSNSFGGEADHTETIPLLNEEILSTATAQKPPILLPPANPQQMSALLSMIYSMNPALAINRTLPFLGSRVDQQQFVNSSNHPTFSMNNTMIEQLTSNQLLAFGLCSLINKANGIANNKIDQIL